MGRKVVVELDVNEDWIEEMAPAMEWLGFLTNRVERSTGHRARVANAYEIGERSEAIRRCHRIIDTLRANLVTDDRGINSNLADRNLKRLKEELSKIEEPR